MSDQTPGSGGQPESAAGSGPPAPDAVPVVDDDIDFYDAEPAPAAADERTVLSPTPTERPVRQPAPTDEHTVRHPRPTDEPADEAPTVTAAADPEPPTQRVFDDLDRGRDRTLGGLRLPGRVESDLNPKARSPWRPPLLVWVMTGLMAALAWMCTFLYPAYSGYDEPFHVDMTYSYYNGNGFYDPGDRLLSVGVQRSDQLTQLPPLTPLSQQSVPPRGQRTTLDAAGGDRGGTYKIPNQMVQHPPLYYGIGAGVMHLIPGSHKLSYDTWVAILRLLSVLCVTPLPILAWASARALIGEGPPAVAAAVLPLTVPNLARVGGNVNNDNLLVLLTAVLILLMCKVIAGDLRKRTGLLVGVVLGLDCLTKGTALVLPVFVLLAYAIAWIRHRRRPWAPVGVAALLTAGIGGWWWVRNLALFGKVQPEGFGGPGSYGYDTFYMTAKKAPPGHYTIDMFIPRYLVRVLWRTWGGIGYPEQPFFSRTTSWVWFGIVAAGAIFAVCFGLRGRMGRVGALALAAPTILILAVPMYNAVGHYTYNGVLPGAQGRYLYPSVTAVGVLVGVGYSRLIGRKLAAWLPLVIVAGAIGTQLLAWRQLVKVWWVPTTAHGRSEEIKRAFHAIQRWAPWPNAVTTIAFVAVGVLAILLLAGAVGYGINHRAGDDEPRITDGETTGHPRPVAALSGRPVPN